MKKILILLLFFFTLPLSAYDVLGLGSPCLDMVIPVQEGDLRKLQLKKGKWHEVSARELAQILQQYPTDITFTGGCVGNTIKGLTSLGISCALTGRVGPDPQGDYITKVFTNMGVTFLPTETLTPSSQIACFVTPDGERSFCSYIAAENEISSKDLKPSYFKDVRLVHMEGYRITNGMYAEEGFKLAKQTGAMTSLDLSNTQLTGRYRQRFLDLIEKSVDIVFASKDQAYALTHLPPEEASSFLNNFCDIVVIRTAEDGCWVSSDNGIFHIKADAAQPLDITGSGDLFISGFLYGYLKKHSLPTCAEMGNLIGNAGLEYLGSEIPPSRWEDLKSTLQKIEAAR